MDFFACGGLHRPSFLVFRVQLLLGNCVAYSSYACRVLSRSISSGTMDRFNGADGVAPDGVIEFQIVATLHSAIPPLLKLSRNGHLIH